MSQFRASIRLPSVAFLVFLAGCSSRIAGIKETSLCGWYVPSVDATNHSRVPFERVAFLDAPPSDQKYRVIGYVCPPAGKFRSWGERLNAVRAAASLYGADAVYIDKQSEVEEWRFSMNQWSGGGKGGKYKDVQIRAVAIKFD